MFAETGALHTHKKSTTTEASADATITGASANLSASTNASGIKQLTHTFMPSFLKFLQSEAAVSGAYMHEVSGAYMHPFMLQCKVQVYKHLCPSF
jgi:hypothetical protein